MSVDKKQKDEETEQSSALSEDNLNSDATDNETNINMKILNIVKARKYIKISDLIDMLKEDCVRASVYRRLNQLKDELLLVKYPDSVKYGIKDNNKKTSYVVRKDYLPLITYVSEVLNTVKRSKDATTIDIRLSELKKYEDMVNISEEQLAILANKLEIKDLRLRYHLLSFIGYQILRNKTNINNKENFSQILDIIPNKHSVLPREQDTEVQVKEVAIHLLSLIGLKDEVIKQLKNDVKNEYLTLFNRVWYDYLSTKMSVALIIENKRRDLFDMEMDLKKKGKKEFTEKLAKVRERALETSKNSKKVDETILKDY
jgi:hypothetical protein